MNDYRPTRYRITDEDRARFGGEEWVVFDRERIFRLPASELMEIESAIGLTVGEFLTASMRGSALGTKATLFLARRWAGMKENFREFDPHIFEVDSEPVESEEAESADPTISSTSGSDTTAE